MCADFCSGWWLYHILVPQLSTFCRAHRILGSVHRSYAWSSSVLPKSCESIYHRNEVFHGHILSFFQSSSWRGHLLKPIPAISGLCKGVAKKNVLPAKIFIELVTIFHKSAGTKILGPIFCNTLNAGLPSYVFTRQQT